MNRVKGKVAIVTGSASGIGKTTAIVLAQEGARVIVSDINENGGRQTVEEIKQGNGEAIFIKHDVREENSWENLMRITLDSFKKLDVLVNNAGTVAHDAIENTSLESWRQVMSVNLEGVFLGTKHAIRAMKKNGGGSIVNIASTVSLVGSKDTAAYSTSKGGVRASTKAAAIELSKAGYGYNIRVNSVHPGTIENTGLTQIFKESVDMKNQTIALYPIGHLGEALDIANAVLYLASDESKFVTGLDLIVDGGMTVQ